MRSLGVSGVCFRCVPFFSRRGLLKSVSDSFAELTLDPLDRYITKLPAG